MDFEKCLKENITYLEKIMVFHHCEGLITCGYKELDYYINTMRKSIFEYVLHPENVVY